MKAAFKKTPIFSLLRIFLDFIRLSLNQLMPLTYYFLYPNLGFSWSARIMGSGDFTFGHRTNLGKNSELTAGQGARISLADDVFVGDSVRIAPTHEIRIGRRTSIQDRCLVFGDVQIGAHCVFAHGVYVSSGRHQYDFKPHLYIKDQDQLAQSKGNPIVIGDDCWLGANVLILPGANIGKGSILAANTVVKGVIPPYSVVAGLPGKVIKTRMDFKPPRSIDYQRETDWPYFYSGFDLSLPNQEYVKREGGLRVEPRFQLALAHLNGQQLLLKLQAGSQGTIRYQQKSYEINKNQSHCQIVLAGNTMGDNANAENQAILSFQCEGRVLIQGAEVV